MLKVCHIISGDLWAGAEAMAARLLDRLSKRECISLGAILFNEGRLARELRQTGVRVFIVDEKRNSFVGMVRGARSALKEFGPQVVHSHGYKENVLAWLSRIPGSGWRLVSTQHGMPEEYGSDVGLKHRLVSRFNFLLLRKKFDVVVAVSKDIEDALARRFKVPGEKIELIYNGMALPKRIRKRTRDSGRFVIGSCGRMYPVKDYGLMVQVAAAIQKKVSSIEFMLAGDGPEYDKIKKVIAQSGLDNGRFRLLGHVHDMALFYDKIDLFINTSQHEGLPMSVLEAMSYGIPVVAPMVGGLPELVEDGKHGFLVRSRDPGAFAERCLLLFKDREKYLEMSRAARARVGRDFSADTMALNYALLYERVSLP